MITTNLTRIFKFVNPILFGKNPVDTYSQSMSESRKSSVLPKLGIFIDFDNVNRENIQVAIKHLSPRWNLSCRRAYGSGLPKHKSFLHANGILPVEVIPNTPGKNSADIALTIDLMLALCDGTVDAFCIVSSDGDFTRLALTIREQGKRVLVAGRSTTPLSFRAACTEFINLEIPPNRTMQSDKLNTRPGIATQPVAVGPGPKAEATKTEPWNAARNDWAMQHSATAPSSAEIKAADIVLLIRELIGEQETTTLKVVNSECYRRYGSFSPRSLGARKWATLLRRFAVFSVEPIRDRKTGHVYDYAIGFRRNALTSAQVFGWTKGRLKIQPKSFKEILCITEAQ